MTLTMVGSMESKARQLWDVWNLRCAVLISLVFQIVLTVSANSRKTRRKRIGLTAIIWLAYLLADWTAAFAVGLISSGQTNDCPEKNSVNNKIAAFWAPFLLLHLGGPDAITAFSLEDNELWIRHFFGLVIQLVAVVYVFVQSLPNDYWIPTALMFFAGGCKYAERTISLYHACLGNFKKSLLKKPDPGPNYAQFMEEYAVLKASHIPVEIKIEKEPELATGQNNVSLPVTKEPELAAGQNNVSLPVTKEPELAAGQNNVSLAITTPEEGSYTDILKNGYKFFDVFKGLVVDHMFSFHERNESREFFFSKQPTDAFKVMEVELNFMYDALYTKYRLVHHKIGYFCRFLCTVLTVTAFEQFALGSKRDLFLVDKIVSYILLYGAVCLELVGMYNLIISDWSIVSAKGAVSSKLVSLPFGKRTRRWSNTMFQHSFLSFCLKERFRWLNDELLKKTVKCEESFKTFIFDELKRKATKAETAEMAKEVFTSRGEWVLMDYPEYYASISSSLNDGTEYDESLLLWHIATQLCYLASSDGDRGDREFCKVVSNYMLYLVIMKPELMSAVAGISQVRFQDTCEEARKFFKRWEIELSNAVAGEQEKVACDKLLNVKTDVKPKQVKGDRSKSLLFDACILANELNKLGQGEEQRRWEMMRKIWVELLSYAASHCRPDVHARQLSEGGELITFVWLLMVHFGLGEQFRIEAGHARAKLLVSN